MLGSITHLRVAYHSKLGSGLQRIILNSQNEPTQMLQDMNGIIRFASRVFMQTARS